MTERPRVSVVLPAYNEGEGVIGVLDRLFESVRLPSEVLVVVDSADDTTVPETEEDAQEGAAGQAPGQHPRPGTCQRHQVRHRRGDRAVVVVTMADGCDDARQIDDLVRLVERGARCRGVARHGGRRAGRRSDPEGDAVAAGRRLALDVRPGRHP